MNLFLYFSITSPIIFLAIIENNKVLQCIQKENSLQHSDNFFKTLKNLLKNENKKLSNINEIYFTSAPGGHSAIRIGLTFVLTLQTLNPEIKIFHINTLLLQSSYKKTISLLSIDKQKQKYYLAIYQDSIVVKATYIANIQEIKQIKKENPDFSVTENFINVNFLTNFIELKNKFSIFEYNSFLSSNQKFFS